MMEPLLRGHHVPQRRPAAQVHRFQVDVLDALPGRQVGVFDQVVLRRRDAGIVERDVDRAVALCRRVEERVDRAFVGNINGHKQTGEFLGRRSAGIAVDVADDDGRAFGAHPPRSGQADAAAAAGDDRDPARQSSGQVHQLASSLIAMNTFLVSVKCSGASGPSSRPSPDCLNPPKGVW